MSHTRSHVVTGRVTDVGSHASPDQTRPDQTVLKAVCGSWVVAAKSIHQAVDARGSMDGGSAAIDGCGR